MRERDGVMKMTKMTKKTKRKKKKKKKKRPIMLPYGYIHRMRWHAYTGNFVCAASGRGCFINIDPACMHACMHETPDSKYIIHHPRNIREGGGGGLYFYLFTLGEGKKKFFPLVFKKKKKNLLLKYFPLPIFSVSASAPASASDFILI